MSGKYVPCKTYGKLVWRETIITTVTNILFQVHILSVQIPNCGGKSNNLHLNISINYYFLNYIVNSFFEQTTITQINILNRA